MNASSFETALQDTLNRKIKEIWNDATIKTYSLPDLIGRNVDIISHKENGYEIMDRNL